MGLLLVMGFLGFYASAGFPGLSPVDDMDAYGPSIWQELSLTTENLRQRAGQYAGQPAVIVPMDKYFLSSELAFYGGRQTACGQPRIAGRGLFGEMFRSGGLMWDYWAPRQSLVGRPILLVSLQRHDLERPELDDYFTSVSFVQRESVHCQGRRIASVYWRLGYGYRVTPESSGRRTRRAGNSSTPARLARAKDGRDPCREANTRSEQ